MKGFICIFWSFSPFLCIFFFQKNYVELLKEKKNVTKTKMHQLLKYCRTESRTAGRTRETKMRGGSIKQFAQVEQLHVDRLRLKQPGLSQKVGYSTWALAANYN